MLEDLLRHDCINFGFSSGRIFAQEFEVHGHVRKCVPTPRWTFNDADLVLKTVLDGQGMAQLPAYQICDYIARNERRESGFVALSGRWNCTARPRNNAKRRQSMGLGRVRVAVSVAWTPGSTSPLDTMDGTVVAEVYPDVIFASVGTNVESPTHDAAS
jgi:DNA-binding transcriptional LysR family regulator